MEFQLDLSDQETAHLVISFSRVDAAELIGALAVYLSGGPDAAQLALTTGNGSAVMAAAKSDEEKGEEEPEHGEPTALIGIAARAWETLEKYGPPGWSRGYTVERATAGLGERCTLGRFTAEEIYPLIRVLRLTLESKEVKGNDRIIIKRAFADLTSVVRSLRGESES